MKYIGYVLLLLLGMNAVQANCWGYAANKYNVSPTLLYAIAQQESSLDPAIVMRNRDGSRDIGLMQINSQHLPHLRKIGINEQQLKDPCTSIIIGASILADMMKQYGYSWEAVGAYNAGTASNQHARRMRYAEKVWLYYKKINSHESNGK